MIKQMFKEVPVSCRKGAQTACAGNLSWMDSKNPKCPNWQMVLLTVHLLGTALCAVDRLDVLRSRARIVSLSKAMTARCDRYRTTCHTPQSQRLPVTLVSRPSKIHGCLRHFQTSAISRRSPVSPRFRSAVKKCHCWLQYGYSFVAYIREQICSKMQTML
jgi:hypothetical protein